MRGRVNTDLYSGISLNANTDQFEVSGGNVVAGDFVQYKYAGAERKTLASTFVNYKFYHAINNFYVTDTGILYEYVSGNLVQRDVLVTNAVIGSVFKRSENYFVYSSVETNGNTKIRTIYFVNVSLNGTFNIIKEYTTEGYVTSYSNGTEKVVIYNNKLIEQREIRSATTSGYYSGYKVYDISDLDNIDELNSGQITCPGSGIFILQQIYDKYLLFTYSSGLYRYEFNDDDNTINNSYNSKAFNGTFKDAWSYDKRYTITIRSSNSGSTNVYDLYIIDCLNMTVKDVALTASEFVVREGRQYLTDPPGISEIDENEEFYLSSNLYNYNSRLGISKCRLTLAGDLELVSELAEIQIVPSMSPQSRSLPMNPLNLGNDTLFIIHPANTGYSEGSGTYYYNARNVNGQMIFGEQSDIVEPYDGTNPKMLLGVAAQSGSSGDTIDVYVPLANA